MFRILFQSVTNSEFKEALDLATTDIKINRIGFGRKTSFRDAVTITDASLNILRRIKEDR